MSREEQEMQTKIETITPRLAAAWLKRNPNNRSLSASRARQLAAAIKRGEWVLNAETIKFDADGMLMDGQHRLTAVVLSETPITTLVVRGVERSAMPTIDVGARRGFHDYLAFEGVKQPAAVAASVKWALSVVDHKHQGSHHYTIPQLLDAWGNMPEIGEHAATLRNVTALRMLCPSVSQLAGFLWVFRTPEYAADPEAIEAFQRHLIDGAGGPEHPTTALRNTWLRGRARGRMSVEERSNAIIRAWNAHQRGRTLVRIAVKTRNDNTLPIVGLTAAVRRAIRARILPE